MGKDKLRRFAENETFPNLIQPLMTYPPLDHELKGKWHENFFHNQAPIVLELGCGRGEYTVNLAEKFPEKNFIGIDWKGARLWRGAKTGVESQIKNMAFLRIQIENIASFFGPDEVDEIWITFPDPHLRERDDQKRLTSHRFLNLYRQFLKPNGFVNLKTDSRFLYDFTIEVIQDQNLPIKIQTEHLYQSEYADDVLSIKTTYEKIWLKEGLNICYLKFTL
ncbi:MAG: tRNA (guanosine(46)-N7)-methyltransferase TrmB [Bacteroidetes bacterium]|nr:tRNA (guanosine(46)-N7)-methyltransferase TrmB [Bacteroidota bacterium]MBP6402734.1 tRNA (guanosine(46)-N7)-methyltransferase TrmB [Bacteroidia bacterium]MBP6650362.1 tRNA (guanosine(46)-N7)-methyltransferase TrmB [Bacteroidia bacterium]